MIVNPGRANDPNAILTDTGFITKNIADNLNEIQLAKTASAKGNAQIKKIAEVLVADHTAMLNDLKKLATLKHISAQLTDRLPNENTAGIVPIPAGSDFNTAWASTMLTLHADKINEVENFLTVSQDKVIKAVAARALPLLRKHKEMLQKVPGAKVKDTKII